MNAALSPEILTLLRCPRTRQGLHIAQPDERKTWQAMDESAEEFLVSDDGAIAYPIVDGFPILLLERALERSSPGQDNSSNG